MILPLRDTLRTTRPPVVTRYLIAANCLVFLYGKTLSEQGLTSLFGAYGVVPAFLTRPDYWNTYDSIWEMFVPLLSSAFLHGGLFHLFSNMWTLWIFGKGVEDRMGKFRFLLFYLLCGILSMLVHVLTNLSSPIPAIGASGAIAGIMGAYLVLFPRSMVISLVLIVCFPIFVPIPAVVYLVLWFASQLFNGAVSQLSPMHGGGIAWWAHVGGFLTGMWMYRAFLLRRKGRRSRRESELLSD